MTEAAIYIVFPTILVIGGTLIFMGILQASIKLVGMLVKEVQKAASSYEDEEAS